MILNPTRTMLLAPLGAFAVVILTLSWYGAGVEGVHTATRASARLSGVVLAVALATRPAASGIAWMRAFLAAHLVHYATVFSLALIATHHHLRQLSVRSVGVVMFGLLLLVPLTFASPASRSAAWRRLNSIALYLAWSTFVGGAALNFSRYWPAIIPAFPLLAAMAIHLWRLTSRQGKRRAMTHTAAPNLKM